MTVKTESCPVMYQLYQISVAHQLGGIVVIDGLFIFFYGEFAFVFTHRSNLLLLRTSSFRIVVWVRMQFIAVDHVVDEPQLRTVGYI